MAGERLFGTNLLALIVILLLLLIQSNSSEVREHHARTQQLTEETSASARMTTSLIDRNRRLAAGEELPFLRKRGDDSAIMEPNPIITANDVRSHMGEEKTRKKRFVFLLPLIPLFGGLTAGTATAAAAVGVGAAAAIAIAQNPIEIPRFAPSYSAPTYVEARAKSKPESKTEKPPRKGQLPPGQTSYPTPKTDEITGFPNLEEVPRNGRKRWRDKKTKKLYEWDKLHGELEEYNEQGKNHTGGYDPKTGERRSDPVPGRTIDV